MTPSALFRNQTAGTDPTEMKLEQIMDCAPSLQRRNRLDAGIH